MFQSFQRILQNRHLKFGVPFIGLLVGASFALTEVTSFRYEFRKTKRWEEEDVNALKNQGVIKRDPNELTLEKLGVEIIEKNQDNLENYENLRIPRPWEDQTEVDFMRQKNRQVKSIKEIKEEHMILKMLLSRNILRFCPKLELMSCSQYRFKSV